MAKRVENPVNPYEAHHIDYTDSAAWEEEPALANLEIYEQDAKSAIRKNNSPDVGFRYGVNPYLGCFHACAYCYARPSHQYWGFGAGTDFDRKIIVKPNVVTLLKKELQRSSWHHETIVFSGNTDCYQPAEASYQLTRGCLEACAEAHNPVAIITKSKLIRRDIDVLQQLTQQASCTVFISVPFVNDADAKKMEPFASPPTKRFETIAMLHDAGIPVGVSVSPMIPGLNDMQIPDILSKARKAGASYAFMTLLRLPREVKDVFESRLRESFPDRADKVMNAIRSMRNGHVNTSPFGKRMRGQGPRWQVIEQLFQLQLRRLGFVPMNTQTQHIKEKKNKKKKIQLSLFFGTPEA